MALFLLVASGGTATVNSQRKASGGPVNPKELEQFLDGFFDQHMQKEHIPGAAFVFVKDNKVFFKKGYGFANLERHQRVSPDSTIFCIGSVSKVFTADAIVQLADQRKIKLNADVNRLVKRSFDAPVKLVWRAYMEPDLMRRCCSGLPGWSMPVCEMDMRVCRKYR